MQAQRFGIDHALKITDEFGTRECKAFRARIFTSHEFAAMELARNYVRTAKAKGHPEANRELSRFHQLLTWGDRFCGLYIDSPEEDVKRIAELRAKQTNKIFLQKAKQLGLRGVLPKIIKQVEDFYLEFPISNPLAATDEDLSGAIARCCDPDWWRRQIKRKQDFILEHVYIQLGAVHKYAGIYASNNCVKRKHAQWHRNQKTLASLEAENDLGQRFNLLDLVNRGVSNPVNRRHELMTRLAGCEGYAKEIGDCGVFITITAPSKYHVQLANPCKPNPKYKGASPRDTNDYLNKVWQLIRASLNHKEIQPYGFRVVEPHHDGTPHWHILAFLKPNEVETVIETIRKYALAESPNEAGAQERRVKVEYINPKKGSAVGYIAKYIAKNIDGEHVGADHYGRDAIESAARIRAWASNWRIRQFQAIGCPSVTVWRLLRGFSTSEMAEETLARIGNEHLNELVAAADNGDWHAFIKSSGGATVPRKNQPLRAAHMQKETPNKYGEAIKKIIGFCFNSIETVVTRFREWKIFPIDYAKELKNEASFFAFEGANAPPWSSVNNCRQNSKAY